MGKFITTIIGRHNVIRLYNFLQKSAVGKSICLRLKYLLRKNNIDLEHNKKLRIALCLSGQLRGYEQAYASIKQYLIDPYDTDVFIHTWSDIGSSSNDYRRLAPPCFMRSILYTVLGSPKKFAMSFPNYMQQCSSATSVSKKQLQILYNPRAMVIEDMPCVESNELLSYEPAAEKNFFGFAVPHKLMEKQPKARFSRFMYYKIFKCNQLKQAAEKQDGRQYDLVIRLRPDLSIGSDFKQDVPFQQLNTLFFRIRTIDPSYQVADQFFFGDSTTMDKVCNAFNYIDTLWKEYENSNRSVTHYWCEGLLYTYIQKYHPHINLVSYRTESAGSASQYQLLSAQHAFTYPRIKDAVIADILQQTQAARTIATPAFADTLDAYLKSILKHDATQSSQDLCHKLIEEFEEKLSFVPALAKAKLSHVAGDLSATIQYLRIEIQRRPDFNNVLNYIAEVYLEIGDFANAIIYAEQSVAKKDFFARQNLNLRNSPWRTLSKAYEATGVYDKALMAYMALFSNNPKKAGSAYRVGKMLYFLGQYDQAAWYLQQALCLDKKHDAALYVLLHTRIKQGMYQDVKAACLKHLHNAPDKVSGKQIKYLGPLALATLHLSKNHPSVLRQEAKKIILQYLALGKVHEYEAIELTPVLIELGEKEKAKELVCAGKEKFKHIKYVTEKLSALETLLET